MKLIGYVRMKGERDGKSYDDFRLFIERSNENPGPEIGGSQIMQIRTQYGSFFPKITERKFTELWSKGMRIGSELKIYRDAGDNSLIVELA